MNFALLLFASGVFLPFKVSSWIDSAGVEERSTVKVDCRAPQEICGEIVMELYNAGFGVSKDNGVHEITVGPFYYRGDSAVLYRAIDGKEDSVKFELNGRVFSGLKEENVSKKGFLSGLLFLMAGYLLFFVIH